jgi:predicted dehydrogenase
VSQKTKIGIIGCGNISGIYCQNSQRFENLELAACADLDLERAKAKAMEHKIPRALSVEALLADPEIQIIVNLTIPKAHFEVAKAALEAGKHVYNEKPLCLDLAQSRELMALAKSKSLRLGGAPDTFLGASLQTCRKLIDDGAIGRPVAAAGFMLCHGHEGWHPDPAFYYQKGGGPLFDMGPYYLTALLSLLGPVKRVSASARASFPERIDAKGRKIIVETPTHIAGLMDFENGAVGTLATSFDVWHSQVPCLEIYGSEGSLSVPDPNNFNGEIRLRRAKDEAWSTQPLSFGYAENSRGLGVADMAAAIAAKRPARASAELCGHVLEIMHAMLESSASSKAIQLQSTCERPLALPLGLGDWSLD